MYEEHLSEKEIMDKIWTNLEGLNRERGPHEGKIYIWRNNTGMDKKADPTKRRGFRYIRYGHVGSGDLIGSFHGRFIAIEVKSKNGRVRKSQGEFIDRINETGGTAIVARSWQDVKEALNI